MQKEELGLVRSCTRRLEGGNLRTVWVMAGTATPSSPYPLPSACSHAMSTTTPISMFAGFEVHPLYDDFSVPTLLTPMGVAQADKKKIRTIIRPAMIYSWRLS